MSLGRGTTLLTLLKHLFQGFHKKCHCTLPQLGGKNLAMAVPKRKEGKGAFPEQGALLVAVVADDGVAQSLLGETPTAAAASIYRIFPISNVTETECEREEAEPQRSRETV